MAVRQPRGLLVGPERVRGADELRANGEMLARFFDERGNPKEQEVRRAAPGGDRDLDRRSGRATLPASRR